MVIKQNHTLGVRRERCSAAFLDKELKQRTVHKSDDITITMEEWIRKQCRLVTKGQCSTSCGRERTMISELISE